MTQTDTKLGAQQVVTTKAVEQPRPKADADVPAAVEAAVAFVAPTMEEARIERAACVPTAIDKTTTGAQQECNGVRGLRAGCAGA